LTALKKTTDAIASSVAISAHPAMLLRRQFFVLASGVTSTRREK